MTVHPLDPAIVVSGCFGGRLARYNRRTEQFRQIRPYPERQDSAPESELRYRIQWNAPVLFSRHDPDVLYHGSQYVAVSRNEGNSWAVISPDLTGNDTSKFGQAGGPITPSAPGSSTSAPSSVSSPRSTRAPTGSRSSSICRPRP